MKKFVTVYQNILLPPIEIVKAMLEGEGILCNLKGYDSSGETIAFGTGLRGMEIQLPEKDKTKAEKIIKRLKVK